jgi:hypothetical protein
MASYTTKRFRLSINTDESIIDRYGITICKRKSANIDKIEISIHPNLKEETAHVRARVSECIKHWAKACYKSKIPEGVSVRLQCGDIGTSNALYMNGEKDDLLVPDIYAFDTSAILKKRHGALKPKEFKEFRQNWDTLNRRVYWRGSTTGCLPSGYAATSVTQLATLPRVTLCLSAKANPMLDIKISEVVQAPHSHYNRFRKWLRANNIYADRVPEDTFAHFRYYPDIPGNASAWGTIKKYIHGSLIFRTKPTDSSLKLYYYRFMEPWKHYIPIAQDFSDLTEKHKWAESNPEEAARIAWRGSNTAKHYLRKINKHFDKAIRSNSATNNW